MPSPKLITLLLVAAFPLQAALSAAHASPGAAPSTSEAPASSADVPDETRLAADLKTHALLAGVSNLAALPDTGHAPNHTTVRSSVRTGDVLEYRVTQLYYARVPGQAHRTVDSIVSYEKTDGGWNLKGVEVTDTRDVQPNVTDNATEPC